MYSAMVLSSAKRLNDNVVICIGMILMDIGKADAWMQVYIVVCFMCSLN
jgi:hypothetical protein